MTEDGLFPIRFRDLRDRLERLDVVEVDPVEWAQGELGCRVLRIDRMGLGSPYVLVRAETEDSMVYPPVIKHVLRVLGIEIRQFLMA